MSDDKLNELIDELLKRECIWTHTQTGDAQRSLDAARAALVAYVEELKATSQESNP